MRGLPVIGILRFLPVVLLCIPHAAQAIQCDEIKLTSASLNTQPHSYDLVAKCGSTVTQYESGFSVSGSGGSGPGLSSTVKPVELLALVVSGDARWDIGTKIAKESVDFKRDVTGSRHAEAVCSEDPFLDTPPGRAKSCGPVTVEVEIESTAKLAAPTSLLIQPEFWFDEVVPLEAAKALSKAPADTAPPPPPPKQPAAEVRSPPRPLAGREAPTASTTARACGNGVCEPGLGENCSSCANDCQCAAGQLCGNGLCVAQAQSASTMARACGNGTCEPGLGENCSSCADDCRCSAGQSCGNGQCLARPASIGTEPDSGSGQACRLTVPYLQPMQPIIETAGAVHQGDNFRIVCVYRTASKELEWPSCDADTQRRVEGYRERLQRSAGFRYSGMLDVNGVTVRVGASLPGGQSGFEIEHLAYQKDTGNVTVVCKVDNMLQAYEPESPQYLESSTSLTAAARVQGRAPVGAADLPARGQVPAAGSESAENVVGRTLNPQPDVPTPAPRDGTSFDRVAAPQQAAMTSSSGQTRMTESGSQPSPPLELPPIGVGVDFRGSGSGSGGGSGSAPARAAPAAQSAAQSAAQPVQSATAVSVQLPGEQRATPPAETVLQRDSDNNRLTEASTPPMPPEAGYLPHPQLQTTAENTRQLSTSSGSDTQTQAPTQPTVPAGVTNSGIANPSPDVVGIEVGCNAGSMNVRLVNTTDKRLEKGTPVRWAVFRQGTIVKKYGWDISKYDAAETRTGETTLVSPLSVGQQTIVGSYQPWDIAGNAVYECLASILPLSQTGGRD